MIATKTIRFINDETSPSIGWVQHVLYENYNIAHAKHQHVSHVSMVAYID